MSEKPYVVVPYKDSVFGPNGKFAELIDNQTVANQIGREVDYLQKLTIAVSALSSLYRLLPVGSVSTVLYPGIIPKDPLFDAAGLMVQLDVRTF